MGPAEIHVVGIQPSTPRLRLVYLRIGYVLSYHQDSLEAIIKIDYPKIVFLWSILNY